MSEIYRAINFEDWKNTVPNVGRDGLVGVVLAVESVNPTDDSGAFKLGALAVARTEGYPYLPESTKLGKVLSFSGTSITGAHVDAAGLPPTTFWGHSSGKCEWTLVDVGSPDPDAIDEYFDKYTETASRDKANHGQIFVPKRFDEKIVQIQFTEPAIFCAAAGLDASGGRNPAIHQVIPDSAGRQDYALNSLTFRKPNF